VISGARQGPVLARKRLLISGPILAVCATAMPAAAGDDPRSGAGALEVTVREERARPSVSSRDRSVASTVIRGDALAVPGTDAADVLSRVPGVQLARSGSSADLSTASVRGATSAQIPIYLAGIRLNDELTGTADLSTVPLFMLDRIEVFRGNAPERADRLGVGGAIYFEPRLPQRTELGFGADVGSFGRLGTWLGGGAAAGEGGALVFVRRARADEDYTFLNDNGTSFDPRDDRDETRQNADWESYDAWSIGRWSLGRPGARVVAALNAFRREQGVTGLGPEQARSARARVARELGGVDVRVPCAQSASDCELELVTSALRAKHELFDPANELDLLAPYLASSGERATLGARLTRQVSDGARVVLSASEELERLRVDRPGAASLRARRGVSRLSAFGTLASGRLELLALGALGCHETRGPGAPGGCGTLAAEGRVGAVFAARENLAFLLNLGRYVRVPTLAELYGTSALVRGSPDLDAETSIGIDAGLRASHESVLLDLWLETFAFARHADDLIGYRRSGLGYVRPFNSKSARVLGLELELGVDLARHVRSETVVGLLDPRDTSADRQTVNDLLPFQSRLVVAEQIELYSEPRAALLERAGLIFRASYRSSRVTDPAGLIGIDEQLSFDLELSAAFWRRRLRLGLAAENLFDSPHFDIVGLPLPGRSLSASAELWFW
jgi:vitamin B12 transporter